MKLYKVNVQTFLNGFLVGTGTYDSDRIGLSADYIEQYCAEQKSLPFEKRHIPPYFEIIDTEAMPTTAEEKIESNLNSYIGMNKNQLFDLCKQRGIEATKKMSNGELVQLLAENDKVEAVSEDGSNKYNFHDAETFQSLSVADQCEYLDDIFSVPTDIEDGSDEEVAYFDALNNVVMVYSGLSLEDETVEKVKEILEYLNGEG